MVCIVALKLESRAARYAGLLADVGHDQEIIRGSMDWGAVVRHRVVALVVTWRGRLSFAVRLLAGLIPNGNKQRNH
jgi:hypothetical protein